MRLDVGRAPAGQAGLYGRREYFVGIAAGRSEIDGGLRRSEHQRDGRRRAGRQGLRQGAAGGSVVRLSGRHEDDRRIFELRVEPCGRCEVVRRHARERRLDRHGRPLRRRTGADGEHQPDDRRRREYGVAGSGDHPDGRQRQISALEVRDSFRQCDGHGDDRRRGRCRDQLGRRYGRDRHDGESDARLRYGRQLRRGGERQGDGIEIGRREELCGRGASMGTDGAHVDGRCLQRLHEPEKHSLRYGPFVRRGDDFQRSVLRLPDARRHSCGAVRQRYPGDRLHLDVPFLPQHTGDSRKTLLLQYRSDFVQPDLLLCMWVRR